MTEQNSNSMNKCPTQEELNLWYDGEGAPGEEFEKHINQCEHCKQCLASYHRIDNGVRKVLSNSDELLADRIIRKCEKTRTGDFFFHILRAAAILLIVLGVVGLFFTPKNQQSTETAGDSPVFLSPADIDFAKPEFFVLIKKNNQFEPLYGPWNREQGIPSNLRLRQTETADQLVNFGGGQKENSPLASVLPRNIRHVWVVNDLEESREKLLEILPEGSRCSLQSNGEDNSIDFRISLVDKNLQEIVNRMAQDFGWALVSSDPPQPREADSGLISQGRVIQYHCTFTLGQ